MQPLNITTKFDRHNAHQLALLSKLVYKNEKKIAKQLHKHGYKCYFFDRHDIQCFIAEHDQYSVICFRGTESGNLQDWATNLKCRMIEHTYGFVHAGFSLGVNAVNFEIKHHLNHNKPVFVTGHSQGAALAGICAVLLRLSGIEPQAVYAYGQPRMGGGCFANNYERLLGPMTYRIVNNNDTVTRIPPRAMNFVHVGQLIYINSAGQVSTNYNNWRRFLDRVKGRIEDFGDWGTDGLKDHAIDRYIEAFSEKVEQTA
jgi:triacylglycerol lipase